MFFVGRRSTSVRLGDIDTDLAIDSNGLRAYHDALIVKFMVIHPHTEESIFRFDEHLVLSRLYDCVFRGYRSIVKRSA